LEAVATIGTILCKLKWGKYQNVLKGLLNGVSKKNEQERYFIGGVCSVLDAFRYPTVKNTNKESVGGDTVTQAEAEKDSNPKHNHPAVDIGNALQTRLLPKIEALTTITKDSFKTSSCSGGADRAAKKLKILCPRIVLALLKLY